MRSDKSSSISSALNAYIVFCAALLLAALMPAGVDASPPEEFTVYVVNYPLQYFAERIGGEHVTVVFPAPADVEGPVMPIG
jgi:ABC-type Zn uptake system ZnuABC Zn-binding protein ZnuA